MFSVHNDDILTQAYTKQDDFHQNSLEVVSTNHYGENTENNILKAHRYGPIATSCVIQAMTITYSFVYFVASLFNWGGTPYSPKGCCIDQNSRNVNRSSADIQ